VPAAQSIASNLAQRQPGDQAGARPRLPAPPKRLQPADGPGRVGEYHRAGSLSRAPGPEIRERVVIRPQQGWKGRITALQGINQSSSGSPISAK